LCILTDLATLKKLFVSPVTTFDDPVEKADKTIISELIKLLTAMKSSCATSYGNMKIMFQCYRDSPLQSS
jgi:hypothetical protein